MGQRRQDPHVLRGEHRAAQRQARSSGGDALGRQTEAPVPACLSIFSRAPSPRAPLGLQEPPLRGPQPGPRLQVLLHQRVHLGPELAVGGRPAGLLPPELSETSRCSRCAGREQGPLSGARGRRARCSRETSVRLLQVTPTRQDQLRRLVLPAETLLGQKKAERGLASSPPSYPEGSGQPGLDSVSVEGIQTQTVTLAAPLPCCVTSGEARNLSGPQLLLL